MKPFIELKCAQCNFKVRATSIGCLKLLKRYVSERINLHQLLRHR